MSKQYKTHLISLDIEDEIKLQECKQKSGLSVKRITLVGVEALKNFTPTVDKKMIDNEEI